MRLLLFSSLRRNYNTAIVTGTAVAILNISCRPTILLLQCYFWRLQLFSARCSPANFQKWADWHGRAATAATAQGNSQRPCSHWCSWTNPTVAWAAADQQARQQAIDTSSRWVWCRNPLPAGQQTALLPDNTSNRHRHRQQSTVARQRYRRHPRGRRSWCSSRRLSTSPSSLFLRRRRLSSRPS